MSKSETWDKETIYITTGIHIRHPWLTKSQEEVKIYNALATPWLPIKWGLLKWRYKCFWEVGDLLYEVDLDKANQIIINNNLKYVDRWWN